MINIKDSSAPNYYDFTVELQPGDKLELSEEGGAVVTGINPKPNKELLKNLPKDLDAKTIEAIKSNRITKTTIAKPWAKDANGKDLKTWYTVENGNILRQNIDLTGALFPVTADPIWCGNVFSSIKWVYRNIYNNTYNWSLELKPTGCGRSNARFNHDATWNEMYSKTSSRGYRGYNMYYVWNKIDNYWSVRNQLYCHTDWVQLANIVSPFTNNQYRDTYNLEPWRSDKGYWGFAWSSCN